MTRLIATLLILLLAACGTSPAARFCVDATGCEDGQSCSNNTCVEPSDDTSGDVVETDTTVDPDTDTVRDTAVEPDTTVEPDTAVEPDTGNCQPPEVGLDPLDFSDVLVDRLDLISGEFFTAVARDENGVPVTLRDPSFWYLDGPSPFAFDAATDNPLSVQLDQPGTWRLTLEWTTADGCAGRSITLRIDVTEPPPPTTIRVTLRWSPEAAGTTTDLDLHMTRLVGSTASWSDANDCYYRNTAPDWGTAGADNNPLFSGDDRGTPGVEVITLTNAADDDYLVGINLYRDIGPPGAEATVSIEIPGSSYTNTRTLSGTGEVWYPVAIRRDGSNNYEVVELNTVSAGFVTVTLP
ncbi:MAG: hypothetical protein HQ461_13795 [Deltaproteobacteria bacterium]|nr:hypothetical protein [Deltaproteobacteria bacterium]